MANAKTHIKPQGGSTLRKAVASRGKTGIGSQPINRDLADSTAFVSFSDRQVFHSLNFILLIQDVLRSRKDTLRAQTQF
jgi:hypothetical protein